MYNVSLWANVHCKADHAAVAEMTYLVLCHTSRVVSLFFFFFFSSVSKALAWNATKQPRKSSNS